MGSNPHIFVVDKQNTVPLLILHSVRYIQHWLQRSERVTSQCIQSPTRRSRRAPTLRRYLHESMYSSSGFSHHEDHENLAVHSTDAAAQKARGRVFRTNLTHQNSEGGYEPSTVLHRHDSKLLKNISFLPRRGHLTVQNNCTTTAEPMESEGRARTGSVRFSPCKSQFSS